MVPVTLDWNVKHFKEESTKGATCYLPLIKGAGIDEEKDRLSLLLPLLLVSFIVD
jgi:hypothetical protein